MSDQRALALRALQLVDLTNLADDPSEADIDALCAKASGDWGNVAAVCVWPQFVSRCRENLEGTDVLVATVTNFPAGSDNIDVAVAETRYAVADGADEVDVVFPYRAWLDGRHDVARALVEACKDACGDDAHLKVIIETGELKTPENIIGASLDAINAGADFIKTSTGKVDVSATPEACETMISVIKGSGLDIGFKAAGGIRTADDAALYLAIADRIMGPDWVSPANFRFGASGLLDDLLSNL